MTELGRTDNSVRLLLEKLYHLEGSAIDAEGACEIKRIHNDILSLEAIMIKFKRRYDEMDPVSGKSKMGNKYRERVANLAAYFDTLKEIYEKISDRFAHIDEKPDFNLKEQEQARLERISEAHRAEEDAARATALEKLQQDKLAKNETEREKLQRIKAAKLAVMEKPSVEGILHSRDKKQILGFIVEGKNVPGTDAAISAALEILVEFARSSETAKLNSSRAIKELKTLFSQIIAHPDNEAYRIINGMNESFRDSVANVAGALEVMASAGWTLHFEKHTDEQGVTMEHVRYRLAEPDANKEMDQWVSWFSLLQGILDALNSVDIQ